MRANWKRITALLEVQALRQAELDILVGQWQEGTAEYAAIAGHLDGLKRLLSEFGGWGAYVQSIREYEERLQHIRDTCEVPAGPT
jgi:hypothetical protein